LQTTTTAETDLTDMLAMWTHSARATNNQEQTAAGLDALSLVHADLHIKKTAA